MSLIQRQQGLVAELEAIYSEKARRGWVAMGQDLIGRRAKAKRLHVEDLLRVGYGVREAWDSVRQCDDIARLNVDHAEFVRQMGGVAA